MAQKTMIGKIVKISSNFTAKVLISRKKKHPKYNKSYEISKKYLVHNPENKYKLNQTVEIKETNPISKNKRFIITQNIKENK